MDGWDSSGEEETMHERYYSNPPPSSIRTMKSPNTEHSKMNSEREKVRHKMRMGANNGNVPMATMRRLLTNSMLSTSDVAVALGRPLVLLLLFYLRHLLLLNDVAVRN